VLGKRRHDWARYGVLIDSYLWAERGFGLSTFFTFETKPKDVLAVAE